MGQVLLQDNIPTPVVASTTTLTLAASNLGQPTALTVGGQQYTLSGTLTLNTATTGSNGLDTGALGAIQLWYIYAIVHNSTFVPALVASLAVPSTGPSMASGSALNGAYGTAYKLVGAFYTDGSSQVGSIVTIAGPATSGWMGDTPTLTGFGSATKNFFWRRNGDSIEIEATFQAFTPTGVAASFTLPGSSIAKSLAPSVFAYSNVGYWNGNNGTSGTTVVPYPSTNLIYFSGIGNSNTSETGTTVCANTNSVITLFARIPISSWNATLF